MLAPPCPVVPSSVAPIKVPSLRSIDSSPLTFDLSLIKEPYLWETELHWGATVLHWGRRNLGRPIKGAMSPVIPFIVFINLPFSTPLVKLMKNDIRHRSTFPIFINKNSYDVFERFSRAVLCLFRKVKKSSSMRNNNMPTLGRKLHETTNFASNSLQLKKKTKGNRRVTSTYDFNF